MVISTELLGMKNALAEKKEKKAAKTGKYKYPNPKFFRMKDHMDWKKQGENLMEVVGICTEMFKEADHKAFWKLQLDRTKDDLKRVALEFNQAKAMSPEELKDVFLNGALRDLPVTSYAHCLYLSAIQKLIDGIHPASEHVSGLLRGDKGFIILKHNVWPPISTLL